MIGQTISQQMLYDLLIRLRTNEEIGEKVETISGSTHIEGLVNIDCARRKEKKNSNTSLFETVEEKKNNDKMW